MIYITNISVSKRSRAARRGEIEEASGEVRELESVPKAEDSVKSSIIRTTIKNENLLNKKIEKKLQSKINKKKNNAIRSKIERSDKLSGVLTSKIEQSINRARYVQSSRKAGWEQINKSIKINEADEVSEEPTEEDIEKIEEDAYVEEFYGKSAPESSKKINPKVNNAFAFLEEAEA